MSLQNLTGEIPGVTMHASQESKCDGCVQSIYRVVSQLAVNLVLSRRSDANV
jgi:hypothetical protein